MTAISWLFNIVLLMVISVLAAAVFRSVFDPGRPGFAFLRIGMDELRMIGLAVFFGVLTLIAMSIAMVLVLLLAGLLVVTAGTAAGVLVGVVLGIALLCAMVWVQIRLVLSFPLTVLRGRITVGEAWRLSAGRFWTLFGALFVVWLIVMGVSTVLFGGLMASYFGAIAHAGNDPAAMQAAMAAQLQTMAQPGPMMIAMWFAGAAVNTIGLALGAGTVATAALQLTGDRHWEEIF